MTKHIVIIILISLLFTGCSHTSTTEAAADQSPPTSQENSLSAAYKDAMNIYKQATKEQDASFNYANYYNIRDNFNIIAYAAGSEAIIDSSNDISPAIKTLHEDIDNMTKQQQKDASKLWQTAQPLYKASISQNLHELIEKIRFPSEKNKLRIFMSENENKTTKQMLTQSNITISSLNEEEYAQLNHIEKMLQSYPNVLSKSETNSIIYITNNLRSSLDRQVQALITYATTNTPESMDEKLNGLVEDFRQAEVKLEELDAAMDAAESIKPGSAN
ncbi:hypothetical protein [Terribacillus sp. DMT04]|uniref:hypothetical protein n=1 Tax=Terribacillus sp. DMT04 TaxID=2850441 RepID=UPI001C2B98F3|nr:hypothetical protein [Terribacillus sp. DMT04]QXE01445.1 hypothetical protein KS242_15905 [Terribacillus sp. DMT04]